MVGQSDAYAIEVGMDQRDVVIADDAVAESREALLNALALDALGERVADVEELLVGGGVGQEQTLAVAYAE